MVFISFIGCSGPGENDMVVQGNIKGLKKGTLYLQHLQDTILISVDSLQIEGDGNYSFRTPIESPEVFYLYLKKKDFNDINDRITFFGEVGTITINSSWNTFDLNPEIKGSASHEKLEEYQNTMTRFNKRELELYRQQINPQVQRDSILFDSLNELAKKNTLRGYLYSLNFALNNKTSYIAPYIALHEVPNARKKYLDSIYNSLPVEVANSKYGKGLEALIDSRE